MAFAIQHTNPTTGTTLVYSNIALRKYSTFIKAPQLFYGKKPILYFSRTWSETPKVSSTKWVCISADPTQEVAQHNVNEYALGGDNDVTRSFPDLLRFKKTDSGSGLGLAIKGVRNNAGNGWSNGSLRIARTSISTTYINVFSWAWFVSSHVTQPGFEFAQWSNDENYFNAETANIFAYHENTTLSGPGVEGLIDGVKWTLVQRWGAIKKATSGTYLYVASPWGNQKSTYGNPAVRGWGIILEPTNSNPYPV